MSSNQSSSPDRVRYWCHSCNAEVPVYMAPDPTCQQCKEQFIEQIDVGDDPRNFLAGVDDNRSESGHDANRGGQGFARFDSGSDDQLLFSFIPQRSNGDRDDNGANAFNQALGPMLQNILSSMLGANMDTQQSTTQPTSQTDGGHTQDQGENHDQNDRSPSDDQSRQQQQQQRRQPIFFYGGMVDGSMRFRPMNMPNTQDAENGNAEENVFDWFRRQPSSESQGEEQQGRDDNREALQRFFQVISAFTGASLDSGFVGNPSDYVLSQAALDNVISQLMEQSGANAPPPAPEEIIEALSKRPLSDDEIARQVDCAVCKDEFAPTEHVVELPCAHIFHDECIKPWLKVNGTCPVCRHSVIPEQEKQQPENSTDNHSPGQSDQSGLSGQPGQADQPNPSHQSDQPSQSSQPSQSDQSQRQQETSTSEATSESRPSMSFAWSPTSPTTWPTSIPRAFTWGPGGGQTRSQLGNSSTATNATPSSSTNQQQPSSSSSTSNNNDKQQQEDSLDLDLD